MTLLGRVTHRCYSHRAIHRTFRLSGPGLIPFTSDKVALFRGALFRSLKPRLTYLTENMIIVRVLSGGGSNRRWVALVPR
jgi:hypothetical protein